MTRAENMRAVIDGDLDVAVRILAPIAAHNDKAYEIGWDTCGLVLRVTPKMAQLRAEANDYDTDIERVLEASGRSFLVTR